MLTKTTFLLLALLGLTSCHTDNVDLSKNEPVLTEGMKITGSMPKEMIVIEGLKGSKRRYSGDGWSKTSTLIARSTRWYGSLGLYDPAESYSLGNRLLLDEGRQFFSSESEALRYIKKLSALYRAIIISSEGL